jgi:hypothetical protein
MHMEENRLSICFVGGFVMPFGAFLLMQITRKFLSTVIGIGMVAGFAAPAMAELQIEEYRGGRWVPFANAVRAAQQSARNKASGKKQTKSAGAARRKAAVRATGGDYLHSLDGNGSRWASTIRVYVQSGRGVPGYRATFPAMVASCMKEWQRASGNAFSWTMVSSPAQANYVISWNGSQYERSNGTEAGLTTTETVDGWNGQEIIESAHTRILTKYNRRALSDSEIRGTILHEIGHGLGLQGHSSHPSDIMYYAATKNSRPYLNARDTNTIRRLYST